MSAEKHSRVVGLASTIAALLDQEESYTVSFNALAIAIGAVVINYNSGVLEDGEHQGVEAVDYDGVAAALEKFAANLVQTTNSMIDEASKSGVKILISENSNIVVPENKIIISK